LSIKEKVKLIQEAENGKKKGAACREFGLLNRRINSILKEQNQNY
jgi:CENP-B N-terminal DNA-binding domain.